MDQQQHSVVIRNPVSSAIRGQDRVSYIREDETSYPNQTYFQQVYHTGSQNVSSRPNRLSLHVDTPDEVFYEPGFRNGAYEGNIAYVKPITRQVVSPTEGQFKFRSDVDEFLIFGTCRSVHSAYFDESANAEELRLREQELAERHPDTEIVEEKEEIRHRKFNDAAYAFDETADGDFDEEIIEDTIITRRKPQTQSMVSRFNSVGVGDYDVNQHFLLDTGSVSVNPEDFPPTYWERLSRYFTEEFKRRRPSQRDVALQLSPANQRTISQAAYPRENRRLRNFGVCVKPLTSSVGLTTAAPRLAGKRNSACMTDDLDEYFARLLRTISPEYPNADRNFIKNLYRYSQTDVSLFIRRLLERLQTLKEIEVEGTPPSKQTRSVGLDFRPVMLAKRTQSEPPRRNLGTNTDIPSLRSQGVSHTPVSREPSPEPVKRSETPRRCVETGSQANLMEPRPISPVQPPSQEIRGRKLTTYRIKRVSGHVNKEGKVSSTKFETSGEGLPPPGSISEALESFIKEADQPPKMTDASPSEKPRPRSTSDSPRRRRRRQPPQLSDNVVVETWFEPGGPQRPEAPQPHQSVSPTLPGSDRGHGSYARTIELARSQTYMSAEESDAVTTPLPQQQYRRTPVARTMSPGGGVGTIHRANPPNIPLRNYSYKVTVEMRKAVEALSSFYLTSPGGTLTEELQEHLDVVRKAWFDVVSQTKIDLEKIEDLFAFLYNSAPQLLALFVRMPTSRGSTCLHYAVGHGAWRVVSLILNTGYADVNKKNSFGFSPIMIAAISDSIDATALPVLERLFAQGDVNARAGTAPGQTPLMLAARKANTPVVELLLRQGADVNAQDDIGNTALMCAIDCKNVEMVRLLVARPELNMDLKDKEGSTALSIAEAGKSEEIIKLVRDKASIFKTDFKYNVSSSSRPLFEPRTFHIVTSTNAEEEFGESETTTRTLWERATSTSHMTAQPHDE